MKKKRSPKQNQRYKLHQVIKNDFRYDPYLRMVEYEDKECADKVKRAVDLLRDKHGYNIQTFIK